MPRFFFVRTITKLTTKREEQWTQPNMVACFKSLMHCPRDRSALPTFWRNTEREREREDEPPTDASCCACVNACCLYRQWLIQAIIVLPLKRQQSSPRSLSSCGLSDVFSVRSHLPFVLVRCTLFLRPFSRAIFVRLFTPFGGRRVVAAISSL